MEVPMDKLANHNLICLAKVGMPVNRNTHRELGELLYDLVLHNRGDNIPICYKVGHIGWVDETELSEAGFIPYKSNALFSLQRNYHQEFEAIKSSGKLEDWVNLIKPYRDNEHEILRIVLAASFSSVLIRKLGALSYVLDLWSRSGLGKTVTLSVAASVWGKPSPDAGYIKSFNSTENAMEQAALFFCDLPFCVDEQQLVPRGRSLTTLIYRLCEGTPRGRATSFGGLNTQHGWRNCTIMTGESPVVNESDAAGMQNRVITVYSDRPLITDSKPEIHEFCQKLDCYYGTAGRSL